MQSGLTYDEAQDIPFGELLDYAAIFQVKFEGCEAVPPPQRKPLDEEIIPDVR